MITETPEVEAALSPLRERGVKIDLKRLLVLGAREQMNRIEQDERPDTDLKARQQEALDAIRELVDIDVLLSGEAWR
jgi:hypothetical protein